MTNLRRLSVAALALALIAVATLALAGRADAFIYWANSQGGMNGTGTIGRADLDGTDVQQSFVPAAPTPQGLAVDATHVYWANYGGGVGRASLDGTGADPAFIPSTSDVGRGWDFDRAWAVAVDGAHVYWTQSGMNQQGGNIAAVGRANLDGTGVEPSFIALTPATVPNGVAVDGTYVYWVGSDSIERANLDGTDVNPSYIPGDATNAPSGVAVDDTHIYWANEGDGTIGRANLDGTDIKPSFIQGANSPEGVAVDGAHIYWANLLGGMNGTGSIGRANLDGTDVNQSFIPDANFPDGVAVDALVGAPPPVPKPDPAQKVAELRALVDSLGLHPRLARTLQRKLARALAALASDNTARACRSLRGFLKRIAAQRGRKLTSAQAQQLADSASALRASLGCDDRDADDDRSDDDRGDRSDEDDRDD